MPNKSKPHKKSGRPILRSGREFSKRADSVKDLLARANPVLAPIASQRAAQSGWRAWLDQRLRSPLAEHVTGVVERDSTLVIFADSAGWSVRLRYAVAEFEPEIRKMHPAIAHVAVRVMPKAPKAPGAGKSPRGSA